MENPNQKKEDRNIRIYKLWKSRAYTLKGLARLFRISTPRVSQIVKEMEDKNKEVKKNKGRTS